MMSALCVGISSASICVNAEENAIELIIDAIETEETTYQSIETQYLYEGENYQVKYTLNDVWDTGYNMGIELTNIGETVIENWAAKIPFDGEVSSVWKLKYFHLMEMIYVLKTWAGMQIFNHSKVCILES